MPQDDGRTILRNAAEYQYQLWTEKQDLDAYRAYSYLIWAYLDAQTATEEDNGSASFV